MKEEVYKRVSKLVSAIVVLNLAFGGFLGLMLIDESENAEAVTLPAPVGGTITITTPITIEGSELDDGTLGADWNLVINAGGNLVLKNMTLIFQSDTAHRFYLMVQNGGELHLENSTITVQTVKRFDNYEWQDWFNFTLFGSTPSVETKFKRLIPFDITVNNAVFSMSEGSSLEYEGGLTITNSDVDIFDSVITSPSAPFSTHDWGIVVQITDCLEASGEEVVIADSRIEKSPWFQGISWYDEDSLGPAVQHYANHTITNSDVYIINTYIDIDYRNKSVPDFYATTPDNDHFPPDVNPYHNALNVFDSTVKFFGLTINMGETGDLIPSEGSTAIEIKDALSTVALYRWLTVLPVDNQTVPLAGATVDIDTIYSGDATINGLNRIDANNNKPVLDYIQSNTDCTLNMVGNTIQATTGTSGKAVFGLLSDLLTDSGWPNSDQKDGYNIVANYNLPPNYQSVGLVDFENFPQVTHEDNFVEFILTPFGFAAPHAELKPEFVTAPPTTELAGINVDFDIRVLNEIKGVGVDVTNVNVQIWDGNPALNTSKKIGETVIPSLPAGTNTTLQFPWTANPPGTHMIYVGVDRVFDKPLQDNAIPEGNEKDNVITAPITVLERPDLFINGSFIYFSPGNKVVNGSSISVNAVVQNIGGSTASNVMVNFYDGTISGPGAYIGSRTITVTAGSSTTASVGWGPDTGFHYVWVYVDELNVIPEKDENNNVASQTIDVKSRPNLNPTIVFNPGSPQFEGSVITIQAEIGNSGGWNVTDPVVVNFYKDDLGNLIGTATIPVDFEGNAILAGESMTVSITWTAEYPPNDHTFFVVVDPDDVVDESDETDNTVSAIFTVNPRPNLQIASSDIAVSDPYPMEGENVNIDITIRNTGLSSFTKTFYVRIWLDEVNTGTMLNEITVTGGVPSGGSVLRSFAWNGVTPQGRHDLWVVLDYNNTISETSETDNSAAGEIVIFKVPSDLIVNDSTFYPGFSPQVGVVIIEGDSSFVRDGYTLVEESGLLIIRNSVFMVIGQTDDLEFNIVVKDTGTLMIDEDSFITTEQFIVNIYLFDDAELYIDGSTIDNKVNIVAAGNSNVYITEQSAIYSTITANEPGSTVDLMIVNSTLTNKLERIGASTMVELWGVYIAGEPASNDVITVSGSAIVYIDWFLTIKTVDINNVPIDGADVMWYRSPPWTQTDTMVTDAQGMVLFRVRGMNITATSVVEDIGSYKIVADFTSPVTLMTYYPDSNVTAYMTMNKMKTIKFSSVRPELDPPLGVDNSPFSVISVGDNVKVFAWINNTGAGNATNVVVRFNDDTSDGGKPFGGWPYDIVLDYIEAGGSQYFEFIWNPSVVGNHNLSVWVDPSNLIIEDDDNASSNYNSIPVFVTPQKADLTLSSGDIKFVHPSKGPTENDTILIQATIHNIGETDAFPSPNRLTVEFYTGDAVGPITFLGWGNITGVPAGQSRVAQYTWQNAPPPDTYWIWVVVDSDLQIEETSDLNNRNVTTITIKAYADITPVGLDFLVNDISVSTTTDTTKVTVRATVRNLGETDAVNVNVKFYEGIPGQSPQIGTTQTIPLIEALFGSEEAEVVWTAKVVGISKTYNISVAVSGVGENIIDNNNLTNSLEVTLRPILTVDDIDFSDNSPFLEQSFDIFATIKNIGGTATSVFDVDFWDGDPDDPKSVFIGDDSISLGIDQAGEVSVSWTPDIGGAHDIYVVVDPDDKIDEANENNNIASEVIVVYSSSDLIVTTKGPMANSPFNIGTVGSPVPIAPQHRGYVLVEEDGILTMTYTSFQVLETGDYEYNIILRNNGTFILEEGSTLLTNGPLMRMYLYDNSTLIIRDSLLTSSIIDIMAYGNSEIIIEESTINSFIRADSPTANVMLTVTNSSLNQAFAYFGGTSKATFRNVTSPSVVISSLAELTVYQWLMVFVRDGAGTGIIGADVNVTELFGNKSEIPDSPKFTGDDGIALFEVKTDTITAQTETSKLAYKIGTDYIYDSILYSGTADVTFNSYVDDKSKNYEYVVISLSALKPDLFVNSTSIRFYRDSLERTTVGVGEPITIEATVWNVGTAGTTASTQVTVSFYIELSVGVNRFLGEGVVPTAMPAEVGSGMASITWIPKDDERGQNKNIIIFVDQDNTVAELTESQDNTNFNSVNIIRPPDLAVMSITFRNSEFPDIDNTTESDIVTIETEIKNIGTDNTAVSIDVMVFDGFPDFDGDMKPDLDNLPAEVELIDSKTIGSLAPQQSVKITFDPWDTTGEVRGHTIYVYALDSTTIGDQILSNNNASETFIVLQKPDLRPEILPPITEYITLVGSDGNMITGNPQIGQTVTLGATIFNFGQAYIYNLIVSFWDANPDANGDGILDGGVTQIGSNATIQITPNSPNNASAQWTVSGPGGQAGDFEIFVWVNPDRKIIESNYGNNIESTTFSVAFADVKFVITEPLKPSYSTEGTLVVRAKVSFTETGQGVAGLPFTLRIRNAGNDQVYGNEITGVTNTNGLVVQDIPVPTSKGNYYVEISVDYGGVITARSGNFEITEEEEPLIPLWMLLLIIVIAVLVVILAGVALARLGLGRLVECGECGAFIPEGEKKCPKCGAVFESDTAKCSECGGWIPVDSKSCPECGAMFAGLEKEKRGYIERMKVQYADYVDQYRAEAKGDLGSAMTDEAFSEWWKASPKYVGFEDWLAREEELKKGRTKNCPSCATVNPESAAICFKCGTVFEKEEEEMIEEEPPQRPPAEVPAKRVTRPAEQRSQPPSVVPKKVVKPPEVVPKKVVKKPPTVVPKKVVKRPPPEE